MKLTYGVWWDVVRVVRFSKSTDLFITEAIKNESRSHCYNDKKFKAFFNKIKRQ